MSQQIPSKPLYFQSIDGLRLIASINIALFHLEKMGGLYRMNGSPAWLFAIVKAPAFHASLFFILGGFIFTTKYIQKADSFRAGHFLKKRFTSLYPLHVATTLFMVPFAVLGGLRAGEIAFGKIGVSLGMHLGMLWSFWPVGTFDYNTPSWALSAFAICYLMLGPLLKLLQKLTSRRHVLAAIAVTGIPLIAWSVLYLSVDKPDLYFFFHVFGPIRFFEFVLGMLLAKLFLLNNTRPRKIKIKDKPLLNDLTILLVLAGIYLNLRYIGSRGASWRYISYHLVMLPLYATLLYRFARGNGFIPGFFKLKYVRLLGVCSFYPYLLHIPLASWTGWTCENVFGYKSFFHSPVNIFLFVVILYGGSAIVWQLRRAKPRAARTAVRGVVSAG